MDVVIAAAVDALTAFTKEMLAQTVNTLKEVHFVSNNEKTTSQMITTFQDFIMSQRGMTLLI